MKQNLSDNLGLTIGSVQNRSFWTGEDGGKCQNGFHSITEKEKDQNR